RGRAALNLLAVFVVGVGVGLSAAWWASLPVPAESVPLTSVPEAKPSAPDQPLVPAAHLPAGELPFDGQDGEGPAGALPRIPHMLDQPEQQDEQVTAAKADAPDTGDKMLTTSAAPPTAAVKTEKTRTSASSTTG